MSNVHDRVGLSVSPELKGRLEEIYKALVVSLKFMYAAGSLLPNLAAPQSELSVDPHDDVAFRALFGAEIFFPQQSILSFHDVLYTHALQISDLRVSTATQQGDLPYASREMVRY